ncbi:hypothetical protein JW948_15935 [bacterium]|nr:hypothetical protein [bacterium]
MIGFEDADQNGINDLFCDADGDGVNDVNGQSYAHSFKFEDKNQDGRNDLWADADGDGVNDLLNRFQNAQPWMDMDGDGIQDEGAGVLRGQALKAHVLDMNRDGKNDITGENVTDTSLGGYRYGSVDEENGVSGRSFVDTDGDGLYDRISGSGTGRQSARGVDVFIDQDGDGIADERGLDRLRARQKAKSRQ